MSFVDDIVNVGTLGLVDDFSGAGAAAEAAQQSAAVQQGATREAIAAQQAATERGLEFLSPFQGIGQQGLDQASFLTDPQAQFQFLQQNPLFQSALQNANTQTQNLAAARGRLSAGDTLQQLSENVLLSASPLISQQKASISDLLGRGQNLATTQANTAIGQGSNISNLITSGGAAQAAGIVGASNARQAANQGLLTLGGTLLGGAFGGPAGASVGGAIAGGAAGTTSAFSDGRLKSNINKAGESNGFNIYTWTWNEIAKELFDLVGEGRGVIAQEVKKIMPDAITKDNGYLKVNYDMIGVQSGG